MTAHDEQERYTLSGLNLSAVDAEHIRMGATVMLDDSSGQSVDVSMHRYPRDGRPRLRLSEVHLDAASSPGGLVCGSYTDDDRDWTVRVAS